MVRREILRHSCVALGAIRASAGWVKQSQFLQILNWREAKYACGDCGGTGQERTGRQAGN